MPPGPAPRPMHGPLHPAAASAPGSTRGPTRGAPAGDGAGGGPQGRAGTRTAPWGLRCRGAHLWGTHLWGMSSTLTRPHTPTTKLSTSHSLTPRAMRKCPSSPHALPHELAAVCNGSTQKGPTPHPPPQHQCSDPPRAAAPQPPRLSPAELITPLLTQYFWTWPSGSCSSPHLQQEGSEQRLRAPHGGSQSTHFPPPRGEGCETHSQLQHLPEPPLGRRQTGLCFHPPSQPHCWAWGAHTAHGSSPTVCSAAQQPPSLPASSPCPEEGGRLSSPEGSISAAMSAALPPPHTYPVIFTECVPCCWCFGPFPSATAVCR